MIFNFYHIICIFIRAKHFIRWSGWGEGFSSGSGNSGIVVGYIINTYCQTIKLVGRRDLRGRGKTRSQMSVDRWRTGCWRSCGIAGCWQRMIVFDSLGTWTRKVVNEKLRAVTIRYTTEQLLAHFACDQYTSLLNYSH